MLNALVEAALRLRGAVIVLASFLLAYGVWVGAHAKLDVFPDFVPPHVTIQTEAPGLSAQQVEELVTRPIESAIAGAGGLEALRSQSIQGLSVVDVVFDEHADIFHARQILGEMLVHLAGELPQGVQAPRLSPMTSATMDLLKIGLLSDAASPAELRTFAQWTMRPRLLSVPGVANVTLFGGDVRQTQIQVKTERLAALDLSISDVVAAARNATGVRGAGFVEDANQRVVISTEGRFQSPEELGGIVLARRGGHSLFLRDVADVVDAAEPKFGDALIQGRPGVLVTMLSQYGANTMDVTRGVEAALEELKPALGARGIVLYPRLHRPATFIESSIGNLEASLALGAVLVAIVLFLFLYNVRSALISLASIPLSLLAAVIVLDQAGQTLNTITLGGLAIALGAVLDDAIIDVENIFRRLRENERLGRVRSSFAVVLSASIEVRKAVVFATFVVALVFLPVLTMSGLAGRMFAPLAQAYILAIMASLLVALTVTPALSLVLLPRRAARAKEFRLLVQTRSRYVRVLGWIAKRTRLVLAATALLLLGGAALVPFFGKELLPEFREGHFVLQTISAPGTSLAETRRLGQRISTELLGDARIATVEQQIGRAELGEDTWGPNRSEFHVELTPDPERDDAAVQRDIRRILAGYPGVKSDVLTFLGDRIGESISGETAPVVVNVFGDDLDTLDAKAEEIAQVLGGVRGAVDVQQKAQPGAPEVAVALRPERLAALGFTPVEVLEAVQTAYQGAIVAQVVEGSRVHDVAVILAPDERRVTETIGGLRLRSPDGSSVPLSVLADVELGSGRSLLLHDGGRRRQTVTCNVEGRDVASFVADAKKKVEADVKLPSGFYLAFGGAAEQEAKARAELLVHASMAIVGILVLLWMVFRRLRNLLLVLANLPFALVGGVLAAWIGGGTLSIGSLVGFVTLFGITTRNSIMMISHFEHLVRAEGCTWSLETVLRGASERFAPIVMTALVTSLGLLPLALGSGRAGREIEGPMAAVILGGLVTSTLLNLLVLPSLALRYGRFETRDQE
jgi:CzcA family heavy metal efflux pump